MIELNIGDLVFCKKIGFVQICKFVIHTDGIVFIEVEDVCSSEIKLVKMLDIVSVYRRVENNDC